MKEPEENKLEELSQFLEDGTREFSNSERWQEYLRMQARMPHYSYNNCLLIALQTKGEATLCQSFTGWKGMERHVKAGEKGIKIMCPAPKKVYIYEPKVDANGNVIYAPDGTVEKERVCKLLMAYKVGYTFDVSQTDGKELPEICTRLDGSVEGAQELLKVLEGISPVPLTFEHVQGAANGFYSPSDKRIVVDSDLSPNHQIHTCLHEITHATLDLSGEDNGATRELKETEAESVAFVVMAYLLGDKMTPEDIGQYSFGYLHSWSSDDSLPEMKAAMQTIQRTSLKLISQIEAVFREREQQDETENEDEDEAQRMCAGETYHRRAAHI
ncbi:MAG: ImmA/IrrE family metallo-endopeptidase [Lachnospiraceae bacterium]|nr:ImmA/IrrE family metallo-endopeptidase [Lachnospiraceae bacterium]MBR1851982.1 ImmA/IrrE family metallo-endopeptidase [Lachnospiraceae bacterium]